MLLSIEVFFLFVSRKHWMDDSVHANVNFDHLLCAFAHSKNLFKGDFVKSQIYLASSNQIKKECCVRVCVCALKWCDDDDDDYRHYSCEFDCNVSPIGRGIGTRWSKRLASGSNFSPHLIKQICQMRIKT